MDLQSLAASRVNMDRKYRDACDTCHTRKIRCTNNGQGACVTCQTARRPCIYSPRDEMGRPRKSSTRTKFKRSKTSTQEPQEGESGQSSISESPTQSSGQTDESRQPSSAASTIDTTEELPLPTPPRDSMTDDSYGLGSTHCYPPNVDTMGGAENFLPMDDMSCFDMMNNDEPRFDPAMFNGRSQFDSSLPTPPGTDDMVHGFAFSIPSAMMTNTSTAQMPPSSSLNVTAISKQMTAILFRLRTKRKLRWSNDEDGLNAQAVVIQIVSELCGLVQMALHNRSLTPESEQADGCQTTLNMLTATAISTIVDIYHSIAHSYTVDHGHGPAGSGLNPSQASTPHKYPVTWLAVNKEFSDLSKILHLDTMDFHLSKLRGALEIIQSCDLQLDMVDDSCSADIQHLRSALQATANILRCY